MQKVQIIQKIRNILKSQKRFIIALLLIILAGAVVKIVDSTGNPMAQDSGYLQSVPVETESTRIKPRQEGFGAKRGAQVTYGADGKPQVLVGKQETFGNGFYVAKPGIDVITNTDPDQLIFNSNQNVFKIVDEDTADITTVNGNQQNVTVTHGLGYAPVVWASIDYGGNLSPLPYLNTSSSAPAGSLAVLEHISIVNITATTFTIRSETSVGYSGSTYTIKYYLLQESAN